MSADPTTSELTADPPDQPSPRPVPSPFQFGLKTLLVCVAAACIMFAVVGRQSAYSTLGMAWFALLVAAHVLANFRGTRGWSKSPPLDDDTFQPTQDSRQAQAPVGRLGKNVTLGKGMLVVTSFGAVAGLVLGTAALILLGVGGLLHPAVWVGGISSAVLGGFLGFLCSSFAEVAGGAWGEAHRHAQHARGRGD